MTLPLPVLDGERSDQIDQLIGVLRRLAKSSNGRWHVDPDPLTVPPAASASTVLRDADGRVCAIVTEDPEATCDSAVAMSVDAVLAAFDAVVAAEIGIRYAWARVHHAEEAASRDHLTGLINRRAWDEAISQEEARCQRNGSRVAVAVVDLDGMKEVNDSDGHLAGDLLLRRAANVLAGAFRTCDVVARLGGDEFAVLAVDLDEEPEPFRDRISDAFGAAGISASVGVAAQRPGETLREVFHRADLAMYASKRER
jgi:diguanylate cyclase (GGDEF)-like protein